MVELVWKGKQNLEQANLMISKNPSQHLYTFESYAGKSTNNLTDPLSGSSPTWHNRLILGDKGSILPALFPEFIAQINLIYIDPPFMTGREFKNGEQLAYSDKWDNNLDLYLQWLYETFLLLKLLLSSNGSLYVHLDWRVTHYAKVILDEVFGSHSHTDGSGFKNEIIWHYQSGGRSQKRYARKHDTILFYTNSAHYCFHGERVGERRGSKKRNHMKKTLDS